MNSIIIIINVYLKVDLVQVFVDEGDQGLLHNLNMDQSEPRTGEL